MLLIKNGKIKPMSGADIDSGYVLIDDNGKIAEVGRRRSFGGHGGKIL